MKALSRLTLFEAVRENHLQEFIAQEESRGVGPIDRETFDALAAALVKAPQSKDQTSHSSSGDDSTGKRTRQGNGPYGES
jgi:hypothetical protein